MQDESIPRIAAGSHRHSIRLPAERGTNGAHCGSVVRQSTDYYSVPLQGTENLPFCVSLRRPFLTSGIAAFR
jgi:hypothetical protein